MNKTIYLFLLCVCVLACKKSIEIVDPYSAGSCVGKIEVGATAGEFTVAVETKGNWRLESQQEWIDFDTYGRTGNGAFTVYFKSNESDILSLKSARIAKVTIRLEEQMRSDTLVFIQQGFYPIEASFNVKDDPALSLEYKTEALTNVTVLCCSSEGTKADMTEWVEAQNADIVVLDGEVSGKVEGLNVVGCDFKGLTVDQEYEVFRDSLQTTYNSGPGTGDNWIFTGQMYHLSAVQAGYENTPEWYPSSVNAEEFKSDLYAWQNNLFDAVWMYNQDYVVTYTDAEARAYSADYMYVSSSVLAKTVGVELMDVEGLSHKPIKLTLKY